MREKGDTKGGKRRRKREEGKEGGKEGGKEKDKKESKERNTTQLEKILDDATIESHSIDAIRQDRNANAA